jgi:DNA processing protein
MPPGDGVAIVGTRHPTRFGCVFADAAAKSAHQAGLAVISGLAAGIDTAAHKSALSAGAPSWAVIGSGVDVPTPIANTALAEEILASGGGLLAEVPPGTAVSRRSLLARDRIQSGLSLAVVVCQCEISSGAMHTARFAVVQQKLLIVARPRGPEARRESSSGNLALVDPAGCDPGLLAADGQIAALLESRRPVADIIVGSPEELAALWERLRPG